MNTRATTAPSIPVVLVRLKLRLLRNRYRRSGALGMVLGAVVALLAGGFGFTMAFAGGHNTDPLLSRAFVLVGATVLLVAWALLPLLTFGVDETLDPARLQLLPLPRRPLMTGLLLSSLVGFAPFGVLVTVAGVIAGYASGAATIVVVVAAVLLVLLAAATARTLATALAATITSRRGRDLLVVVGAFLAIGVQLLRFVNYGNLDPHFWDSVSNVVAWFPPGMLGQAIVDAHTGHVGRSLLELVPALVALPLLLSVWGRALERSLTVVTGGSTRPRRAAAAADESAAAVPPARSALLPRHVPFLRPTPWGAVAGKELRYVARDPRRRVAVAQLVAFGVGVPLWIAIKSGHLPPGSVLFASFAGYLALLGALNQFGFDGGAFWLDVVAGNRIRDELVGKNFAVLVQVLPVVFFGSVVLAAFSGGWVYVPVALVVAAAGVGAGLAVANVVSVRFPQRLPESKSPFATRAGGQGCVTSLVFFVAMAVQGMLLAPVAIATAVCAAVAPVALIVVAPLCAAYGYALWRAGVGIAERSAWWRQPEMLLAIDPRRGM